MATKHETMRGECNPMHRPEVAAKQSASLRKTWADPVRRAQMLDHKKRLADQIKRHNDLNRAQKAEAASRKWSEERKLAHSQRMKDYWAKINEAIALLQNAQHEHENSIK